MAFITIIRHSAYFHYALNQPQKNRKPLVAKAWFAALRTQCMQHMQKNAWIKSYAM